MSMLIGVTVILFNLFISWLISSDEVVRQWHIMVVAIVLRLHPYLSHLAEYVAGLKGVYKL